MKMISIEILKLIYDSNMQQIDILTYIINNTDRRCNLFIGTYSKIREDVNVSQVTIAKTMKTLQENNLITLVQNGVWRVSNDLLNSIYERKVK